MVRVKVLNLLKDVFMKPVTMEYTPIKNILTNVQP